MPKQDFSRTAAIDLILEAFSRNPFWTSKFKLEASPNHDILISQNKHKISGSAYRVLQRKAYHHGTFLVNADLNNLRILLKPQIEETAFQSTLTLPSRRSPVCNVRDFAPTFTFSTFNNILSTHFLARYPGSVNRHFLFKVSYSLCL